MRRVAAALTRYRLTATLADGGAERRVQLRIKRR